MDRPRVIDKVFSGIAIGVWVLFIISSAIVIPITIRGYYFLHCQILDIPGLSGYSMEDITLAFNDVMDFIWLGKPFATGNLAWSEEGRAHFADCVPLFWLDLIVFLVTSVLLLTYAFLLGKKVLRHCRFLGISSYAYAGMGTLLFFLVVGIYGLVDFDGLFVLFHSVFFPGKSNWIFDPNKDQIINILPESFFACCGAFIGSVALLECVGGIVYGFVGKHVRKKRGNRQVK